MNACLAARALVAEEVEDTLGRDREPEGSSSVEDDARWPAWVVDALPGHDTDVLGATAGQSGPLVRGRGRHATAEAHDHPLRQLQHALPPLTACDHCTTNNSWACVVSVN
jgi:hypothetical protein